MGLKELIEISKPRIVLLLVIIAVTSMYAASKMNGYDLTYLNVLHIIIAGTFASAGSSALNHYYDRDIDPMMNRTSNRPIPSGRINKKHVLLYGIIISIFAIIYSVIFINYISTFFILLGIIFYVVIYTMWLKRNNPSNIVIGGFAGSAASMAGWSAATNNIDITGFLISMLVFIWTPSHFWCLAMKIKDDYESAKIPMLPVIIGMKKTSQYIFINTIILIPYSIMLYTFGLGLLYLVVAIVSGGSMLLYHHKLMKNPTVKVAWKAYKITAPYLMIIFISIALDALFNFKI
ncbi:MAG: heme o synthase [Thaumarchaeota archaeon]|nr:heme o synthase [Nitrososphaerota archaeon]